MVDVAMVAAEVQRVYAQLGVRKLKYKDTLLIRTYTFRYHKLFQSGHKVFRGNAPYAA